MVEKSYLRYELCETFGVISSGMANVVSIPKTNLILAPALENVYVWDMRTSLLKNKLKCNSSSGKDEVTFIAYGALTEVVAVGYTNGNIKLFNLKNNDCLVTLSGHKRSVTAMVFNEKELLLASGSIDTDLIVWDIVAEKGLFRLKGHKSEITQLFFMKTHHYLLSSSKDSSIRCWDLSIQACIYTLIGHRSEVCSFLLIQNEERMITASFGEGLKVWDVTQNTQTEDENIKSSLSNIRFECIGEVQRSSNGKIQSIKAFENNYLLVQGWRLST